MVILLLFFKLLLFCGLLLNILQNMPVKPICFTGSELKEINLHLRLNWKVSDKNGAELGDQAGGAWQTTIASAYFSSGPSPLIWRSLVMNVWDSPPVSLYLNNMFLWREYEGGSALDVIARLPRGAACWDTPLPPSLPPFPPPPPSLSRLPLTPLALISQPIHLSWGDSPVSFY